VAHVKGLRRGPSTSVEVEAVGVFLVRIQQLFQVSVREENAATEQRMGRHPGQPLDPFNQLGGNALASELLDELLIVDLTINPGVDVPRGHLLFLL